MSHYVICFTFLDAYYIHITVMEGVIVKEQSINSNKKLGLGARIGDELRRNFVLYLMAIPVLA